MLRMLYATIVMMAIPIGAVVPNGVRKAPTQKSQSQQGVGDSAVRRVGVQVTANGKPTVTDDVVSHANPNADAIDSLSLSDRAEVAAETKAPGEASDLMEDFLLHQRFKEAGLHRPLVTVPKAALVTTGRGKPNAPQHIFVFTHHKTGTHLGRALLQMAGTVLGTPFDQQFRNADTCFPPGHLGLYTNLNTETLATLRQVCPDFRAVHIVREALAVTGSGFLYHRWCHDTIRGTGPEVLQAAKTLDDKLRIEANAAAKETLPEMASCHKALAGDPRVLTVGLEGFHDGFDNTTNAMFSHLFGADKATIDQLVSEARAHDVSRWPPEKRQREHHVASAHDVAMVTETLAEMLERSEPAVTRVASFDAELGY